MCSYKSYGYIIYIHIITIYGKTNAIHMKYCPTIDFATTAAKQQTDPVLTQLNKTSLKLQALPIPATNITIICDVSTGLPHPNVPISLDDDSLYSLAYPGTRVTQKLLTACYVWPKGCSLLDTVIPSVPKD